MILLDILKYHHYKVANMLTMITLSVEHFHSTLHIQQMIISQLQYTRKFMKTIKQFLEKKIPWSAKVSWYPPAKTKLNFHRISAVLPQKE